MVPMALRNQLSEKSCVATRSAVPISSPISMMCSVPTLSPAATGASTHSGTSALYSTLSSEISSCSSFTTSALTASFASLPSPEYLTGTSAISSPCSSRVRSEKFWNAQRYSWRVSMKF